MSDNSAGVPISKEEIIKAVVSDLGTNDFQFKSFSIKGASDDVLGFMGEHLRISVDINHGGVDKQRSYFAKLIPFKVAAHKEYAEKTRCFYKEIELYKTLFDDMKNAVTGNKEWRPKCYFTRDWDVLLVEDLGARHFYMLPERSLMGIDHVRISIKTMARMHAGSFILEEKLKAGKVKTHSPNFNGDSKSAVIGELYPNLVFESECTNDPSHPGSKFWEVGIMSQLPIIDLLPGYSDDQKRRIREKMPDTMRMVFHMLKPSTKFKNIMIHADLWGNNILFRNDDHGKPCEAVILDFQMTRYAPPTQDFFMFLHIVQDDEFRDKYEKELLALYYQTLKEELEDEGLEIEKVFTKAELEESCEYYKKYAILNQIIYTQLNIAPAEICNKFMATQELYNKIMQEDRSEMLVESFKTNQFCKIRTIEAMDAVIHTFNLC